jgi:hypothetical protein
MERKFKSPQTQEEFEKMAKDITPEGADSVINALRKRRAAVADPINREIQFYKAARMYGQGDKIIWSDWQ